jgi:hypothetical protein
MLYSIDQSGVPEAFRNRRTTRDVDTVCPPRTVEEPEQDHVVGRGRRGPIVRMGLMFGDRAAGLEPRVNCLPLLWAVAVALPFSSACTLCPFAYLPKEHGYLSTEQASDLTPFGEFHVDPFAADPESCREEDRDQAQEEARYISVELERRLEKLAAHAGLKGPPLTIRGTMTLFDPGTRGARFFAPGVLGTPGTIHIKVTLVDPEGRTLASGDAVGTVEWGFLGGSIRGASNNLIEGVIDCIRRKHRSLQSHE